MGAFRGVLGKVKCKLEYGKETSSPLAEEVMSKLVGGAHFLKAPPGKALFLARGTKARWSHPSP